ncbi:YmdB family metallophosphoesterase [Enterococcus faecium]|nr:YmdB family metallophosphoesterase [Enterococcus faecium]
MGDVVGSMGREMITEYLPRLKKKYRPQVTIVNGENALLDVDHRKNL